LSFFEINKSEVTPVNMISQRLRRDIVAEWRAIKMDFFHSGRGDGLRPLRDIDRIGTSG